MTGRYVEGIGGSSRLYAARIGEFSIGPVKSARKRLDLYVIGETTFTPAFDAIVGAPFLLQADLEFDLRAKHMKFFRPQNCDRDSPAQLLEGRRGRHALRVQPQRPARTRTSRCSSTARSWTPSSTPAPHRSFLTLRARQAARHRRQGAGRDAPGRQRRRRLGPRAALDRAGQDRADRRRDHQRTPSSASSTSRAQLGADLYLGQDFLRAHRVLFAMSQRKLYIAYLGGDVFTRGTGLEPGCCRRPTAATPTPSTRWPICYNTGRGAPRDPKQAQAWLEKAAAAGQPNANLALGRQQMLAGQVDEAIPKLRAALDQLPAERLGRCGCTTPACARARPSWRRPSWRPASRSSDNDDWPAPIAEFYLGKLDAGGLLESAAKDKQAAHARTCMATSYMGEWHAARDEKPQAEALLATLRAECRPAKPAAPAAAGAGASAAP